MNREYLQLLARRESKEVFGKKYANLWLLILVLIATFLSISFSNGSLIFLKEKMDDPFTNWVNIARGYGSDMFEELRSDLVDTRVQKHYNFSDVQGDNYMALNFYGKNQSIHYLECRFFERLNTSLVDAILAEDNVIGGCRIPQDCLVNNTLGLIITADVLSKLGYSVDSIPAYVYYLSNSRGADDYGIDMIQDIYAAAPMPLLGVVRRLPMNMDVIGSIYFDEQYENPTHPFSLNDSVYARELIYYVNNSIEDFKDVVKKLGSDAKVKVSVNEYRDNISYLSSWCADNSRLMRIYYGDNLTPMEDVIAFDKKIQEIYWGNYGVERIYRYNVSDYTVTTRRFLSVNFAKLDSIRAFENYAKSNFNVQIEMSQVTSKENFNAVSVMANILSWAMIVFSIVCIVMFIINMLQSYFQKVKKNLGTFKAFGISNAELIKVYTKILFEIIIIAVCVAIGVNLAIQWLLPIGGVIKDGEFNYLSLWSYKTLFAVIIIIFATILTVRIVMRRMLRQTPGDLIYDR